MSHFTHEPTDACSRACCGGTAVSVGLPDAGGDAQRQRHRPAPRAPPSRSAWASSSGATACASSSGTRPPPGAGWALSPALEPLAPVKDYLNVVSGMDIKIPSSQGHHTGEVGHPLGLPAACRSPRAAPPSARPSARPASTRSPPPSWARPPASVAGGGHLPPGEHPRGDHAAVHLPQRPRQRQPAHLRAGARCSTACSAATSGRRRRRRPPAGDPGALEQGDAPAPERARRRPPRHRRPEGRGSAPADRAAWTSTSRTSGPSSAGCRPRRRAAWRRPGGRGRLRLAGGPRRLRRHRPGRAARADHDRHERPHRPGAGLRPDPRRSR